MSDRGTTRVEVAGGAAVNGVPETPHFAEISDLIAANRLEDAVNATGSALESLGDAPRSRAELLLLRGQALFLLGRTAEAEPSLLQAAEFAPEINGNLDFLLIALWHFQRLDQLILVADVLLARSPGDLRALAAKAHALRQAGRQDEALRAIRGMEVSVEHPDLLAVKAALLCDIGDFARALELLVPATTPVESANPELLSLRGWADQNSAGKSFAEDGERVYRAASLQEPDDLWYRKGLGNALRRLGRTEEANREYEVVIAAATKLKEDDALDPYTSCLAGWCYYCSGRPKDGARFYAAGLAAKGIGPAAQFDYALILLADGRQGNAVKEYATGIQEARSRNVLRRCGILYIALYDLRNLIAEDTGFAALPETAQIRKGLREALLEVVDAFEPDWKALADRTRAYVRIDEQESAEQVSLGAESWSRLRVVGFSAAPAGAHSGLLLPVLGDEDGSGRFQLMLESGPALGSEIDSEQLRQQVAAGTLVWLARTCRASAASRVLWVSERFLEMSGVSFSDPAEERLAWQEVSKPVPSFAALTTRQMGERLLDDWARILIERAAAALRDSFNAEPERTLAAAASSSGMALEAARTETAIYQAALLLGATGGARSEHDLRTARPDLPEIVSHDGSGLWKRVEEFKELARLRAGGAPRAGSQPDPQLPVPLQSAHPVAARILARAYHIAQVPDLVQQDRLAALAAAEIQLLAPLDSALKMAQQHLTESLTYFMVFYLETEESILAIGREPAFYTASVLRPLSRPAVDSFAFRAAAERLRSAASAPNPGVRTRAAGSAG